MNFSINKILNNKKAQQEIVGFALIIILVAVILLALLAFALRNPKDQQIESYEIKNFIDAAFEHTVNCGYEPTPLRKLVYSCYDQTYCTNGVSSCEMLKTTLEGLLNASWNIGEQSSIKGYTLKIIPTESTGEAILEISKGNSTNLIKGESQDYPRLRQRLVVELSVYY